VYGNSFCLASAVVFSQFHALSSASVFLLQTIVVCGLLMATFTFVYLVYLVLMNRHIYVAF